jgi:hypothetical protein
MVFIHHLSLGVGGVGGRGVYGWRGHACWAVERLTQRWKNPSASFLEQEVFGSEDIPFFLAAFLIEKKII